MPDRIDPPDFNRFLRRLTVVLWLLAGFVLLPLVAWLASR